MNMYNKRKKDSCSDFTAMSSNEQFLYGPLLWIGSSLGIIFAILKLHVRVEPTAFSHA